MWLVHTVLMTLMYVPMCVCRGGGQSDKLDQTGDGGVPSVVSGMGDGGDADAEEDGYAGALGNTPHYVVGRVLSVVSTCYMHTYTGTYIQ